MEFQLEHLMVQHSALLTTQCLVLLIIANLEYNLVISKVDHLVFLIELLKAYLKIPCLALMKAAMNTTHLALMNHTLKESRRDLHLDLSILLTVIYYKLQRALLT